MVCLGINGWVTMVGQTCFSLVSDIKIHRSPKVFIDN